MYRVTVKDEDLGVNEKVEILVNDFSDAEFVADKFAETIFYSAEVYYVNEEGVQTELVYTAEWYNDMGCVYGEYHGSMKADDDEPYDPFDEVGYNPYTGGYDSDL